MNIFDIFIAYVSWGEVGKTSIGRLTDANKLRLLEFLSS